MITINLLPKNLRRVERKIVVPYKAYVLMTVLVFLLVHVLLLSAAGIEKVHVLSLRHNWGRLAPQSKEFLARRKELKAAETDIVSLKMLTGRPFSLTEMLSVLAGAVPPGLWLDRLSLSPESIVIQGSVVSKNKNEMTIIGQFLEAIRTHKTFAAAFEKIELNSVQRRTVKTYDVVDFVLVGNRKPAS
jgi:hypothetical protein